jgi:hypothetical protein
MTNIEQNKCCKKCRGTVISLKEAMAGKVTSCNIPVCFCHKSMSNIEQDDFIKSVIITFCGASEKDATEAQKAIESFLRSKFTEYQEKVKEIEKQNAELKEKAWKYDELCK